MYHAEHRVTVVRQRKPLKHGQAVYVKLRWWKPMGGWAFQSLGDARKLTAGEIERARDQKQLDLNTGQAKVKPVASITLGELKSIYADRRRQGETRRGYRKSVPRLKDNTISGHVMTLRYLIDHFGESKVLAVIDEEQVEVWVEALVGGQLNGARAEGTHDYPLGNQTVRMHLRNCQAIYNWAMKVVGVSGPNPFADFDSAPIPSNANPYVPHDRFVQLIGSITDPGERAFYGLCRWAGLRRGEALGLPWSGSSVDRHGKEHEIGVDLKRGRLCLVALKTGTYREVPISPCLAELLIVRRSAVPGCSISGLSGHNLNERADRYCEAAGIGKWSAFFQSMRSSCENDWKVEGIAEPTYTAWLGHSVDTSRRHYVAPTDAEFAQVTKAA